MAADGVRRGAAMKRIGWGWRRRGSPLSRWLAVVGGPLVAMTLLALYALFPDPELWTRLSVLLFFPIAMFAMLLFEETGSAMRRDATGRVRRSRRR
jgi:hypothetical protein